MKKRICYVAASLLLLLTLTICTGCGGNATGTSEPAAENDTAASTDVSEIDVDLTTLSSTMVYSEVYNMVNTPDDYVGKIIKMKGTAASFYDENEKETYYACIIQDATACCSQGLEYVLQGSADYPRDDEEITVVGEFQTYTLKDGMTYCTLLNAQIVPGKK